MDDDFADLHNIDNFGCEFVEGEEAVVCGLPAALGVEACPIQYDVPATRDFEDPGVELFRVRLRVVMLLGWRYIDPRRVNGSGGGGQLTPMMTPTTANAML